jgi:hypothetical protein
MGPQIAWSLRNVLERDGRDWERKGSLKLLLTSGKRQCNKNTKLHLNGALNSILKKIPTNRSIVICCFATINRQSNCS